MSIPTSNIAFQPQTAQTQLEQESGFSGSLSSESSSGNSSAGEMYENESRAQASFVRNHSGLSSSELNVELQDVLKSRKNESEYTEWKYD